MYWPHAEAVMPNTVRRSWLGRGHAWHTGGNCNWSRGSYKSYKTFVIGSVDCHTTTTCSLSFFLYWELGNTKYTPRELLSSLLVMCSVKDLMVPRGFAAPWYASTAELKRSMRAPERVMDGSFFAARVCDYYWHRQ